MEESNGCVVRSHTECLYLKKNSSTIKFKEQYMVKSLDIKPFHLLFDGHPIPKEHWCGFSHILQLKWPSRSWKAFLEGSRLCVKDFIPNQPKDHL